MRACLHHSINLVSSCFYICSRRCAGRRIETVRAEGMEREEYRIDDRTEEDTHSSTVYDKFPTYSLSLSNVRERGCCPEAEKEDRPEGPATEDKGEGDGWDG